jgi:hypothetical protein
VVRLREESIRSRGKMLEVMRAGKAGSRGKVLEEHVEHMRDLILRAYKRLTTIDVLNEPVARVIPGTGFSFSRMW